MNLSPKIILLTVITALTLQLQAVDSKKVAARDAALKEADKKALAANMAAYDKEVKPFLEQHCIRCHGPKKLKGDLALDLLDPDMKESTSASRWAVVRDYLEGQEMPPEDEPQPKPAEVEPVLAWIKAEMKRARRNFTQRLMQISGNKVQHDLLFDPNQQARLNIAPRIRRHSVELYEQFRKEQAKGFDNLVGNPFTPDPRFIFHDMGAPMMDVPTTSQLLRNALTIMERLTGHTVEKDGSIKPMIASKKDYLQLIDPKVELTDELKTKAIHNQFRRVLEREPSEDEIARFKALMDRTIEDAGRTAAIRYTLAAVYLIPDAIFRTELGAKPDNEGKARLTQSEIANAVAFTLSDERPPEWLAKEVREGKLENREQVAATVQKMLDDPKVRKPRILRFFHEFFEYQKAPEVFKNPDDFRSHKARVLVSDTDNLIRWILKNDKEVLKELLTTNKAFVNTRYDTNKKLITQYEAGGSPHRSYSLPPDWKWTDEQPIEMPSNTRAGILTQPSWLVAWSMNTDNHAILRGKWIRERLLGNVVPDIPITVDAQLPEAPEQTLRERMAVTEEEYCWQCHKLMNDVGLPFETYDHFGRWRAQELGKPVNAKGGIHLTGDKRIDHVRTNDAIGFVKALASSERVEQVFIRHVFRYFTGRNENLGDGSSLRAAHKAYRDSEGSFNALIVAILSSDSFLYRTPSSELANK